ncbi:hypothetical protein NDU88_004718 [Pleurodeles waltl]|uniref:Uncharacterized protein n=1 Tax=Pleurodeles waltl TaxID=8319 RepID=A0AAV7MU92_PLEWA|nr:hypothetical protein NDU88_004718 [Pleurodeles waltl]
MSATICPLSAVAGVRSSSAPVPPTGLVHLGPPKAPSSIRQSRWAPVSRVPLSVAGGCCGGAAVASRPSAHSSSALGKRPANTPSPTLFSLAETRYLRRPLTGSWRSGALGTGEKGKPLALVGLAEAYFNKLAPEQGLIGDSDAQRIGRGEGLGSRCGRSMPEETRVLATTPFFPSF